METAVLTPKIGHTLAPALTAHVDAEQLEQLFPNVRFEELGDYEAPEPSLGAAVRLDSGFVAMLSWGRLTHELVVELPPQVPAASFLNEVSIPMAAITWTRRDRTSRKQSNRRPTAEATRDEVVRRKRSSTFVSGSDPLRMYVGGGIGTRLVKRYDSRKLYDVEESRYVSLEDIAAWVRTGQEVKVVDNDTSEDLTPQTLTQIILDEGKKGTSLLPSELLHELVRIGERTVSSGVEQLQHGVDRVLKASMDRLGPVRRAREEMSQLRERMEELESSLEALERSPRPSKSAARVAGTAAARKASRPTTKVHGR